MPKSLDSKTILLIVLTACAILLTLIRERSVAPRPSIGQTAIEEGPPLKAISPTVDSTLRHMGVSTDKIRRLRISVGEAKGVREELRVAVPAGFEVLRAITSLTDSLKRFNVTLVSTENLKEKTSSIHLIYEKRVFESIVMSKERTQKGAEPSVRKNKKGTRHKAPR
jgi:hypothetical protein